MSIIINKTVLVLIAVCLILASCANGENNENDGIANAKNMPSEMPDDFNIIFRYGVSQSHQRSGIDTLNGVIYKDLVLDGEVSGEFTPSNEMLEKIYQYLYEVDILNYPKGYNPPYEENMEEGHEVYMTPSNVYKLKISYGEVEHAVYWHNSNGSRVKEAMALESAFRNIIVDIANTEEFLELGNPNGGYQ